MDDVVDASANAHFLCYTCFLFIYDRICGEPFTWDLGIARAASRTPAARAEYPLLNRNPIY